MSLVLLPNWSDALTKTGLDAPESLQQKKLPTAWQPDVRDLRPESFPTPFGRAEATAFSLAFGTEEQLRTERFASRFRILVEAAALGLLEAEVIDLSFDAGRLGKALLEVHPEREGYRYLTILKRRAGGQETIFGASSPRCLFFGHSRRTEPEWSELKNQVERNSNLNDAHLLLAEFRESLRNRNQWDPKNIPWMRGFDLLVKNTRVTEGLSRYRDDSRTLCPVPLWTGEPAGGIRKHDVLFFPTLDKGYGKRLLEWMRGTVDEQSESSAGFVRILNERNDVLARIRLPKSREGVNAAYLGAGLVRPAEPAVAPRGAKPRLDDDQRGRGFLSVLQPVFRSFDGLRRQAVVSDPAHYPDIVSRTLRAFGDVHTGLAQRVYFSQSVEEWARDQGAYPDDSALEGEEGGPNGFVANLDTGKAVYVERWNDQVFHDLSSLGYVLFQFFSGQALLADGQLVADDGEPLVISAEGRPIDVQRGPYAFVTEAKNKDAIARRLATLQRFHRSYSNRKVSAPGGTLAKLAGRAFVNWALGRDPLQNGTPASEWSVATFGTLGLPLARDAHGDSGEEG
jgi:hypothetical protein